MGIAHFGNFHLVRTTAGIMAPKVKLQLTPAEGSRLAETYTAVKMHGQGYVSLHVLGMEPAAGVESQMRDRFSDFATSVTGITVTAIRMRGVEHLVKKPLGTILEAARAGDSELVELNDQLRCLPIYVDFKPLQCAQGNARRNKASGPPANVKHVAPATDNMRRKGRAKAKSKGGAPGTRASLETSALCRSVMAQWWPMDEFAAYHRRTVEKVPDAWLEGMVSLTQLMSHEQRISVDHRSTIKSCMFKLATNRHAYIHGSAGRKLRPTHQKAQELAVEGAQWKKLNGAVLAAGRISDALVDANIRAMERGFLPAGGSDDFQQDLLNLLGSSQTRIRATRGRSRQLLASQKPVGKRETGQSRRAGEQEDAPAPHGDTATAARCKKDGAVENAQAKTGQGKRAPVKRKAQEPAVQSGQKGRPAIKVEHAEASESAGQGRVTAKEPTGEGGQIKAPPAAEMLYIDLTTEDEDKDEDEDLNMAEAPAHVQKLQSSATVTEEVARAAIAKRKSVAIPDDELAQLGLSSSSDAGAEEAAELFWAGEELFDVGDGRSYPRRYLQEEGDTPWPMGEWMQKEAHGSKLLRGFEATAILDERTYIYPQGLRSEYIVKWKGFALNAWQWLPHEMLARTKAMDAWAQKRAAGGQRGASCHAEWAHLSAYANKASASPKPHKQMGSARLSESRLVMTRFTRRGPLPSPRSEDLSLLPGTG